MRQIFLQPICWRWPSTTPSPPLYGIELNLLDFAVWGGEKVDVGLGDVVVEDGLQVRGGVVHAQQPK